MKQDSQQVNKIRPHIVAGFVLLALIIFLIGQGLLSVASLVDNQKTLAQKAPDSNELNQRQSTPNDKSAQKQKCLKKLKREKIKTDATLKKISRKELDNALREVAENAAALTIKSQELTRRITELENEGIARMNKSKTLHVRGYGKESVKKILERTNQLTIHIVDSMAPYNRVFKINNDNGEIGLDNPKVFRDGEGGLVDLPMVFLKFYEDKKIQGEDKYEAATLVPSVINVNNIDAGSIYVWISAKNKEAFLINKETGNLDPELEFVIAEEMAHAVIRFLVSEKTGLNWLNVVIPRFFEEGVTNHYQSSEIKQEHVNNMKKMLKRRFIPSVKTVLLDVRGLPNDVDAYSTGYHFVQFIGGPEVALNLLANYYKYSAPPVDKNFRFSEEAWNGAIQETFTNIKDMKDLQERFTQWLAQQYPDELRLFNGN